MSIWGPKTIFNPTKWANPGLGLFKILAFSELAVCAEDKPALRAEDKPVELAEEKPVASTKDKPVASADKKSAVCRDIPQEL